MKFMLFLGSGVSLPSGLPGVNDITAKVLSGDYFRHTDGFYYRGTEPSPNHRASCPGNMLSFSPGAGLICGSSHPLWPPRHRSPSGSSF